MKLFLTWRGLERPGVVGSAEESPKSGRAPATAMRTVQLTLAALAACAASSAPDCRRGLDWRGLHPLWAVQAVASEHAARAA